MCNHYSSLKDAEWVQRRFGVQLPAGTWKPDVYPGDSAPIIRRPHGDIPGEREVVLARCGLIPWLMSAKVSHHQSDNHQPPDPFCRAT